MKFSDVRKSMIEFNEKHNIERKVCSKYNASGELITMVARVVIAKHKFREEFQDEKNRTYEFDNYNKALTSGDLGYSIFAYNPFDDDSMRLESYNDTDIEKCEIIRVVE